MQKEKQQEQEVEKAELESSGAVQPMNNQALSKIPPKQQDVFKVLAESDDFQKMKAQATLWKQSQFVSDKVSPTDILIIVAYGKELGLSPFEALTNIYVVDAKPSLSARLMRAIVQRRFPKAYFKVTEMSDKRGAMLVGQTKDMAFEYEFTQEEAKKAGLWGHPKKPVWSKYPKNMLLNRAMSTGIRFEFPDCFLSVPYTVDESYGWEEPKIEVKKTQDKAGDINSFVMNGGSENGAEA